MREYFCIFLLEVRYLPTAVPLLSRTDVILHYDCLLLARLVNAFFQELKNFARSQKGTLNYVVKWRNRSAHIASLK